MQEFNARVWTLDSRLRTLDAGLWTLDFDVPYVLTKENVLKKFCTAVSPEQNIALFLRIYFSSLGKLDFLIQIIVKYEAITQNFNKL